MEFFSITEMYFKHSYGHCASHMRAIAALHGGARAGFNAVHTMPSSATQAAINKQHKHGWWSYTAIIHVSNSMQQLSLTGKHTPTCCRGKDQKLQKVAGRLPRNHQVHAQISAETAKAARPYHQPAPPKEQQMPSRKTFFIRLTSHFVHLARHTLTSANMAGRHETDHTAHGAMCSCQRCLQQAQMLVPSG